MKLKKELNKILSEFQAKRPDLSAVKINAPDAWNIRIDMTEAEDIKYRVRNLRKDDLSELLKFRNQLSRQSRDMFCPYPWNDKKKLEQSLVEGIQRAISKIDASFLTVRQGEPIGHFFLWKAGGNPYSQKYGLEIPELGVAVADTYQGQGLGLLQVRILLAIAEHLNRDAVELTTALSSDAGWQIYLKAVFKYLGIIKNPLEIDVTEAVNNRRKINWREERQMVFIINQEKTNAILQYLSLKRKEYEKFIK